MDQQRKRELAEKFVAMALLLPSVTDLSIADALKAIEAGEDFDEKVRTIAQDMLSRPGIDWDELEQVMSWSPDESDQPNDD